MANPEVRHLEIGQIVERFEVEMKGFVVDLPNGIGLQLQTAPYIDIVQGYLPDGGRLRAEIFSDEPSEIIYSKTTKSEPIDGRGYAKLEKETRLSEDQFREEWEEIDQEHYKTLRKRRFNLEDGLELNLFIGGKLDGRFVVEKEFEVRDGNVGKAIWEAADYRFPGWIEESGAASSKKLAEKKRKYPSREQMPKLAPKGIIYLAQIKVDLLRGRTLPSSGIIYP